jgi:predicted thioesterase
MGTTTTQQHQKDLERIKGFRLMDDEFMSKVFDGEITATELILRIILEDESISVQEVTAQYEIKNLQGRSIRLDIKAIDGNGRIFDVEIQRADKGAVAERARFNSSIIDANQLKKKQTYTDLKDNFVIFFTENDVLGDDLPIYHVERVIQETGKSFNDGEHIIYVNGAYRADTPLGKLVHDFNCTEAKDMYYKELAERVRYFKETEKGVETMCRTIELMRNETAVQASIQTAKSFGVPDEKIVEHLLSTYDYLSEDEAVRLVEEFDED